MNTFQTCRNTSDAVLLYLPQNLYLKPIARIHISVQLPQKIKPGKSISNWEIMEKLRLLVRPEEFSILKLSKNTLEYIRFEAEIEDKAKLYKVIAFLDARTIKLNAFTQNVKVRACEAKLEFPNKHSWNAFFRDAKNMNEMKPGERPDTLHISNLPIKWFVPAQFMHKENLKPSQKIFQRVFEKFGNIRCIDIPICDSYRSKMKEHITGMKTFTFDQDVFFEGYVQFKDYVGFTRAMDAFRGMKLLYKGTSEAQTVNINVNFDKTKHLSDTSIRKREIIREKLIAKDRDKEEKEQQEKLRAEKEEQEKRRLELEQKEAKERRRREREERRKARHFAKLKLNETDELQKKIAKEESKLIEAQRKLEAIRLLEALFARIKAKLDKEENSKSNEEHISRDEITKYKKIRERKLEIQREKYQKALEGRVVLDSILGESKSKSNEGSSDSDSELRNKRLKKKKHKKKKKKSKSSKDKNEDHTSKVVSTNSENIYTGNNWFPPPGEIYHYPPIYPMRGVPIGYYQGNRGRGMNRIPGTSRGTYSNRRRYNSHYFRNWRGRRGPGFSKYPLEVQQQYYRYFSKFLEDKSSRSNSRSRSRSNDRRGSRRSSYKRTRSRSRSNSRYSRRKSRSYSRSKSRDRRTSRTKSHRSRKRSSSNSSYRSIDSSEFISPRRLRSERTRSRSWSFSKGKNKKDSWSKSPDN